MTTGRTGRPPLTERRKTETRLEVAHAAVRLFLAKGVADTSAEEIAAAAGISARTLWRYFPTKDSCIAPLLTVGTESTAELLRSWGRDQSVADLIDLMGSRAREAGTDWVTMVDLVRLTQTEPGLRAVWLDLHRQAELAFAEALAHRAGLPGPDLTVAVQAATINAAFRVAIEYYAFNAETDAMDAYRSAVHDALLIAARGLT